MYGVDADRDGAQAYYDAIFELYASWGVDYVKVDDICNVKITPLEPYSARREIEMIRRAIDRCGRDMVLSLSPVWLCWKKHGILRKTRTCGASRTISGIIGTPSKKCSGGASAGRAHVKARSVPGLRYAAARAYHHRGDSIGHNTNLTHAEQITMMTLWGIFRSPLIMGGEMRDNDAFTLSRAHK